MHAARQKRLDELQSHRRSLAQSFRAALSERDTSNLSAFKTEIKDVVSTAVKSLEDVTDGVELAQQAVDETTLELQTMKEETETLARQLKKVIRALILSPTSLSTYNITAYVASRESSPACEVCI